MVAVDADDEGIERTPGSHVPTTLSLNAEGCIEVPSKRTRPTGSPFVTIVVLDRGYEGTEIVPKEMETERYTLRQ